MHTKVDHSTRPVTVTGPRRPALPREVAMRLAAEEYQRVAEHLRSLSPEQWQAATCCPPWDVRRMACHVLGMAEFAASLVERVRQLRAAKRQGGLFIDALTGLQVAKHQHRSPEDLVAAMSSIGPRAVQGRRRTPAPMRRLVTIQAADSLEQEPETWTLGYLLDVILTRDTWMHRSDVAAATGTPMRLTKEHDGAIVADVVEEWVSRHGRPCRLTLTGPAGGSWQFGDGGEELHLDAVEFCRLLSGRGAEAHGLLGTRVPF